jgi:hypothetical protein
MVVETEAGETGAGIERNATIDATTTALPREMITEIRSLRRAAAWAMGARAASGRALEMARETGSERTDDTVLATQRIVPPVEFGGFTRATDVFFLARSL